MEHLSILYRNVMTQQVISLGRFNESFRKKMEEELLIEWNHKKAAWENRSLYERIFESSSLRSDGWTSPASSMVIPVWNTLIDICFEAMHGTGLIPNKQKKGYDVKVSTYHDVLEEGEEGPETFVTSLNEVIVSEYVERRSELYQEGYVCLVCIKQSADQKGGGVTYYPNFIEEVSLSSVLTNLATQCIVPCATPNRELDIPLQQGEIIVLSGSTHWKMNPMKGKDDTHVIRLDFFKK